MGQRTALLHRFSRIFHRGELITEQQQRLQEPENVNCVSIRNNSDKRSKNRWSANNLKSRFLQSHYALVLSSMRQQDRAKPCYPNCSDIFVYNVSSAENRKSSTTCSQFIYEEKVEVNDHDSFFDRLNHDTDNNSQLNQPEFFYAGPTNHTSSSLYSTCSTSTGASTVEDQAKRSFCLSTSTTALSPPLGSPNIPPPLEHYQLQYKPNKCQRRRSPLLDLTPPSSPTPSLRDIVVDRKSSLGERGLAVLVQEILGDAFQIADDSLQIGR